MNRDNENNDTGGGFENLEKWKQFENMEVAPSFGLNFIS